MAAVNAISTPARDLPVKRAKRRYSPALILYFVVFSGSIYLLFGGFDEGLLSQKSGDSPFYLGLLFLTYFAIVLQLAAHRGAALAAVSDSTLLLLFICSGIVSLVVAGAAGISVVRFFLYVTTISAGLLISIRYSLDEFCETFFNTSIAIIILHFLAYPLLAGRIDYDPLNRATLLGVTSYAGLFPHKSVAATFFSLSLIISVARFSGSRARTARRLSMILAIGSVVGLLISGALGRLAFLLIGALGGLLIRALLRRDLTSLIVFGIGLTLGTIGYYLIGDDTVIYFFGRSWDLTGRQELFDLWPRFFWEKPVFGYGFDGFFTDVAGTAGDYLSDLNGGRGFSTFESVYLDLLIEFGALGGLFFACILLRALWKSISFYNASTSKYRFVPLLLMVWTITGSALDSGVLTQNSLSCVLVFWIYSGVDRFKAQAGRSSRRNRDAGGLSLRGVFGEPRHRSLPAGLRAQVTKPDVEHR